MQSKLTIGMDIGKAQVVVACHESAFAVLKMANAVPVLRRWLATLPAGSRLGLEATGGYHEPVAELAHSLGFTVYILNPKDVHHYARALGARGKTDWLDAQVIAAYVAEHNARLHAFVPLSADEKLLRELARRRATLVNAKSMLQQSLRVLPGLSARGASCCAPWAALRIGLNASSPKSPRVPANARRSSSGCRRSMAWARSPAFVAQRSSPGCHCTAAMRRSLSLGLILDPTIPASTAAAGV